MCYNNPHFRFFFTDWIKKNCFLSIHIITSLFSISSKQDFLRKEFCYKTLLCEVSDALADLVPEARAGIHWPVKPGHTDTEWFRDILCILSPSFLKNVKHLSHICKIIKLRVNPIIFKKVEYIWNITALNINTKKHAEKWQLHRTMCISGSWERLCQECLQYEPVTSAHYHTAAPETWLKSPSGCD